MDIRSKLKTITNNPNKNKNKNRLLNFNAKRKWKFAFNKLRPIFRLAHLTQQIQLYGSPVFEDDHSQLQFMISKAGDTDDKENSSNITLASNLLNPKGTLKTIWSAFILIPIIFIGYMIPIKLAFYNDASELSLNWIILEYILDFLFAFDIVVNMLSPFYDDDDNLITSINPIIINYFKSLLIIVIIACVPIDFILIDYIDVCHSDNNECYYNGYIEAIEIIYRLLRMGKLMKVFGSSKSQGNINNVLELIQASSMTSRMISFMITLTFIMNIFSCLWYKITDYNDSNITWTHNLNLLDESKNRIYGFCLYWVIYTLSTIGYGGIHGYNNSKNYPYYS